MAGEVTVRFAPELRLFLRPRHRSGVAHVGCDGTSSLGHVVTSLGVPLTEVGEMRVAGHVAAASYRPGHGDAVTVTGVRRPQPTPTRPARFLLDVHLGALARRLRLLGVDAAYRNDAQDEYLVEQANREERVLLSQDRGLLRRRAVRHGAYVRGARPDEQLTDVLDRFAPVLAPWTRCTACNGLLRPVPKTQVLDLLEPGTRRTYEQFAQCADCGRVFWRGAHHARLSAVVTAALTGLPYRR